MVTVDELKTALDELEKSKKSIKGRKKPAAKEKPLKDVKVPAKLKAAKALDMPGSEIYVAAHYDGKLLNEYSITREKIPVNIKIVRPTIGYNPIYDIYLPDIGEGTWIVLDKIRSQITTEVGVRGQEVLDVKLQKKVEKRFRDSAIEKLKHYMPGIDEETITVLSEYLINDMLGLGKIELLLADDGLEEIVINSSREPIWVYHKMHGWLKTNLKIKSDEQTADYANSIGRRAERQINTLNPLMDAHLPTGERVNATLLPISTDGNTITIRKFSREPWTIVDFINNKTLDATIGALLWTAIHYELNVIVAGGTASGKTSLLNSLTPFLPPNHRIVSIEDTRELRLPSYLQWVPMLTRQPNPEGKGGVTMLNLMVNSLRMRPDRVIVGEIRRHEEAEVLFEAMHTGHSVYSTLHANTADEVRRRLVTPPLSIPETLLESLHLVSVQFRHRKKGIRRVLQIAEVLPSAEGTVSFRDIYKWRAGADTFGRVKDSVRVIPEIQLFTGMSLREINDELKQKEEILNWLVKQKVATTEEIGRVISEYYTSEEVVVEAMRKNKSPKELISK
ncbi:MAG: Flp pilus assembly complex ATPase component TadA [Candidatus Diapherotrites archaeon]|nr:Flp pilus assembly complex ATPase component TadA [Candidatus Diapherotrites archaeon]